MATCVDNIELSDYCCCAVASSKEAIALLVGDGPTRKRSACIENKGRTRYMKSLSGLTASCVSS